MAVGIIIGAAFGTIVTSLVADVLMPRSKALPSRVDFANLYIRYWATGYPSLAAAQAAGAGDPATSSSSTDHPSLIVAFALLWSSGPEPDERRPNPPRPATIRAALLCTAVDQGRPRFALLRS
jgi:hypothetical protein